jgi:ligand-binding sensor protein
MSKPNPFCQLLLENPEGRTACENCWLDASLEAAEGERINTCHAGLTYLAYPIHEEKKTVAYLLAGQFISAREAGESLPINFKELAERFELDASELEKAAHSIPVYGDAELKTLQDWPIKISAVLEGILEERTILLGRLRRIAEISAV